MLAKEVLYLSIATALILVTLTIILAYLILRKAKENKRQSKVEMYKKQCSEPILTYLLNEGEISRGFLPDTIEKKLALEDLLTRYSEVLEGETEKKNLYSLAEIYLSDYYKQLLLSRKWSSRVNALYHIEDFQIRSIKAAVKNLIDQKQVTKAEKVLGLRILALFQYENLFHELITNHSHLSEFDYRSILFKAHQNIIKRFVLSFYQCQSALQFAILEIIALKNELKYVPFIESVYQTNSGELRLRALKALASIGYVKKINDYLPLCQSSKWQERMMLAKLLGSVRAEEGLICLELLLHDPTWWVRSQSGQAIKNYPNGTRLLKKVYETSTDPFARDMAWEWLNKGE